MLGYAMYVCSISFQISGSFLLVCMSLNKTPKRIAQEVTPIILTGTDLDNLKMPGVPAKLLEMYLAKKGFLFTLIGYILSTCEGEKIENPGENIFWVILLSSLISYIGIKISKKQVCKNEETVIKECQKNIPMGATIFKETSNDES